jgi:hypothetical protein
MGFEVVELESKVDINFEASFRDLDLANENLDSEEDLDLVNEDLDLEVSLNLEESLDFDKEDY